MLLGGVVDAGVRELLGRDLLQLSGPPPLGPRVDHDPAQIRVRQPLVRDAVPAAVRPGQRRLQQILGVHRVRDEPAGAAQQRVLPGADVLLEFEHLAVRHDQPPPFPVCRPARGLRRRFSAPSCRRTRSGRAFRRCVPLVRSRVPAVRRRSYGAVVTEVSEAACGERSAVRRLCNRSRNGVKRGAIRGGYRVIRPYGARRIAVTGPDGSPLRGPTDRCYGARRVCVTESAASASRTPWDRRCGVRPVESAGGPARTPVGAGVVG